MNTLEYTGPERRNYFRVIYKPSERAGFQIAGDRFEVLDINEGGVRFLNSHAIVVPAFIKGQLHLLNGDRIEIEGKNEWEQDGEVGISLSYLIPSDVIEKEQRYIILNCD